MRNPAKPLVSDRHMSNAMSLAGDRLKSFADVPMALGWLGLPAGYDLLSGTRVAPGGIRS